MMTKLFLTLIIILAFICVVSVIIGISNKNKIFPIVSVCCSVMIIALSFCCAIDLKSDNPSENEEKISVSVTHTSASKNKIPKTTEQDKQQIVYITRTGKKYHYSYDCSETDFYECTLEEALELELEPCSNCVK